MLCARAAPMEGSGCAADPPAREKFLKFCKSGIDIPTKTRYTIEAVRNAAQGPVAQLDRVFDYESKGRGFESRRAHQGSSCKAASFFAFWPLCMLLMVYLSTIFACYAFLSTLHVDGVAVAAQAMPKDFTGFSPIFTDRNGSKTVQHAVTHGAPCELLSSAS